MKPHLAPAPRHLRPIEGAIHVKQVPVVVLSESTSLAVVTADGRPLLEITCDANGPTIRLRKMICNFSVLAN